MKLSEQRRIRKIIGRVAFKQSSSVGSVRREMRLAVDAAFSERHEPGHEAFLRMFGDCRPSVEEFILRTAAFIPRGEE